MEEASDKSIKWLQSIENQIIPHQSWVKTGQSSLESDSMFCNPEIVNRILKIKSSFDRINRKKFMKARSICNPFERIGRFEFQNRAAVKMSNLDFLCDFELTNSIDLTSYFADVCAGPGGFTEYLLWRTNNKTQGFGFTLRGKNDFNINVTSEVFQRYYGVKNDGNILDPENISSLKNFIIQATEGARVQLMMADGGFHVHDENIQEHLHKQLYLCQCIVSLSIVRDGGDAVVKFFDCYSLFTVGLLYLMYSSFNKVSIVKPISSRPANSERYLICKDKKSDTHLIEKYLIYINKLMWSSGSYDANFEVFEIVPFEILSEDKPFFEYIVNANETIGERQIFHLTKIKTFIATNKCDIKEQQSYLIKNLCLEKWKLLSPLHEAEAQIDEKKKPIDNAKKDDSKLDEYGLEAFIRKSIANHAIDSGESSNAKPAVDWNRMVEEEGPISMIDENKKPIDNAKKDDSKLDEYGLEAFIRKSIANHATDAGESSNAKPAVDWNRMVEEEGPISMSDGLDALIRKIIAEEPTKYETTNSNSDAMSHEDKSNLKLNEYGLEAFIRNSIANHAINAGEVESSNVRLASSNNGILKDGGVQNKTKLDEYGLEAFIRNSIANHAIDAGEVESSNVRLASSNNGILKDGGVQNKTKLDEYGLEAFIRKSIANHAIDAGRVESSNVRLASSNNGTLKDGGGLEALIRKCQDAKKTVDDVQSVEWSNGLHSMISKIIEEKTSSLKRRYEGEIEDLKRKQYICPFYGRCQCCHFWSNGLHPFYGRGGKRGNHNRGVNSRGRFKDNF